MTLYISGPITGTHDYQERFAAAQKMLEAAGHQVINPVLLPHEDTNDWKACMRLCIQAMRGADGVCMLDGWLDSRGAVIEWDLAHDADMPVGGVEHWCDIARLNMRVYATPSDKQRAAAFDAALKKVDALAA